MLDKVLGVVAFLLIVAFGSWFLLRARAKSEHNDEKPAVSNLSKNAPAMSSARVLSIAWEVARDRPMTMSSGWFQVS
jgi:hypothetical protein